MIDWKNISLKDLAGHLSKVLKKEGIDLILVGGACATIYSKNRYQSYDLDFITYEDMNKVKRVLRECGFEVEGIDFDQLKKWSKNEGYEDKFNEFSKMLKGKK